MCLLVSSWFPNSRGVGNFLCSQEADTNTTDDNEGLLDFDEFVCFYKRLSTRPELLSLLQEYSGGKDYLTRQDFELFLRLEQGEKEVTKDLAKQLMERFEPVPENLKEGRLGIDGEYIQRGLTIFLSV